MNTTTFYSLRYFFEMLFDPTLFSYGRAVRKNPRDADLHIKIATIFLVRFQSSKSSYHWAQAVRHFQHGQRLGAFSGQCYLVLGADLEKHGDSDRAHEIYRQGLNLFLNVLKDDYFRKEACLENLALIYRFLQHKASTDPHSRTLLQRIPEDVLEKINAKDVKTRDSFFIHESQNIRVEVRQYPRLQTSSETDLWTYKPEKPDENDIPDRVLTVDLLDLSEKGVKVRLATLLNIGATVKLTLFLTNFPVTVTGSVRWVKEGRDSGVAFAGIELVQVSEEDRPHILKYIRKGLAGTT